MTLGRDYECRKSCQNKETDNNHPDDVGNPEMKKWTEKLGDKCWKKKHAQWCAANQNDAINKIQGLR